jgi:hypothetical protein
MKCKLCGCTDKRPCSIPMCVAGDQLVLAIDGQVSTHTEPCAWLADSVCSAPACVEKAYNEAAMLADQISFFLERSA